MDQQNYVLIRSSKQLAEQGWIGYGWARVNFSDSNIRSWAELLKKFQEVGQPIGRARNQIKRFYNLLESPEFSPFSGWSGTARQII